MKCSCRKSFLIPGILVLVIAARLLLGGGSEIYSPAADAGVTIATQTKNRSPLRDSQTMNADNKNSTWANFTKPSDSALKQSLSALQYKVTQHEGTERAFQNEFWDNKQDGFYVDIVSGDPLFSSRDKFDSGTGWPSFTCPVEPAAVTEKTDYYLIYPRTEVRSKHADSHLGHVFNDGPNPTGLRYCINSAALRFIPAADLEKEGYGNYANIFD